MGCAMQCPACGTDLPDEAAYCSECGVSQRPDSFDLQSAYSALPEPRNTGAWGYSSGSHESQPVVPVPEPVRERPGGMGFRREGPLGKLASLLSLPATLVGIYLAIRFWGDDHGASFRVLGALTLFALAPLLLSIVFIPLGLLLGLLLQRTSDDTRWGAAAIGRSVFDGLSNIISLAALGYIFMQLIDTFQ